MMKRISYLGVVLLLLLSSCEKVIQVDLNEAAPQIVIEAALFEGTHDFVVKITQTGSYFSPSPPVSINDAQVSLWDGVNPPKSLIAIGNGLYELLNFTANTGTTYTLQVSAAGKTYEAQAYLPVSPQIDSMTFKEFNGFFGGGAGQEDPRYLAYLHFRDSIGIRNYYRIQVTKNDTLQNGAFDILVFDDEIRDGQYFDMPAFRTLFREGDSVDIDLLSMDKNVYDYFDTLQEILSGDVNNSAAPANPNTNWNNKALGYFAAYSAQRRSLRIKP